MSVKAASGVGNSPALRTALDRLGGAQKKAARSAPAYSRYVNRRLGRYLAALAFAAGLSPNAVTGISAVFTFAGIVLLMLFPPSLGLGVAVALLLATGYALDSADGQLARLTRSGSSAGEWLDHMVDAAKTSLLPLALAVGLYRFDAAPPLVLLVPLSAAVVCAVLFFGMILTEQLRRQRGVESLADDSRRPSWVRSLLVVPMDYGLLCWVFVLYGAVPVFMSVYTVIVVATAAFLVLASVKWFRELSVLPEPPHGKHLREAVPDTT
ncbi:CDP-alcohol phosphatidyltransferase family protein [Arthrobacter sp. SW1]|uniref:CDP-alcohol phosphatidyltransferase family protein n=1 Tax=Arthrobacter sp. SW1 TaxID=1920889 RepID=UPI0009F21E67|nr:CDP-alcohol phosphatidyltransferase family protein [Arthrobacter sp. SW1]